MSGAGADPSGGMSPTCPACGGELAPWLAVCGGEPSDPRTHELARCERCGTRVTMSPAPGPAAYESGIYSAKPPRARRAVGALQRRLAAEPVTMLRRAGLQRGARVLDAGAGGGRLVGALRSAGYDARGIEPSQRSASRALASGLPVTRASLEQHEDSGLGAVVLWHVLEHLDEPGPALERAAGWLAPGGLLLAGLPNPDSWQAAIGGPGWLHWDAPRHRVHLSAAGVDALLARAGLERERTRQLVWEHNPGAMWMALLSRAGMTPGFPFHLVKRNVPARPRDLALLAVGVPLAPVAVALEAVAAAAGRGGTVAVVARRQAVARKQAVLARKA